MNIAESKTTSVTQCVCVMHMDDANTVGIQCLQTLYISRGRIGFLTSLLLLNTVEDHALLVAQLMSSIVSPVDSMTAESLSLKQKVYL